MPLPTAGDTAGDAVYAPRGRRLLLIEMLLLAFGVPLVLFGLLLLLERFETWLVVPGERAAKVVELLHSSDGPEEVEQATARMLEVVVPVSNGRGQEVGGA